MADTHESQLPVAPIHGTAEASAAWRARWSQKVAQLFERTLEESGARTQFHLPRGAAPPQDDEVTRSILWPAFPQALGYAVGPAAALEQADWKTYTRRLFDTAAGTPVNVVYRAHTEYCEWHVERDLPGNMGPIRKVVFTTESNEYWSTLAAHDFDEVLRLYRALVSPEVQPDDLRFPETMVVNGAVVYEKGSYNRFNRWNLGRGIAHLSAPLNGLNALMTQCAAATIGRELGGRELVDPTRHLGATHVHRGAWGIDNASDHAIIGVIGGLARARARITMTEPLALILAQLDTRGWELPPPGRRSAAARDRTADSYWTVIRHGPAGAVRAEYHVPIEDGFAVSDILIRGVPIAHGAQIARCVTVGARVTAGAFGTAEHQVRPHESRAMRSIGGSQALVPVPIAPPMVDPRLEEMYPEAPTSRVPAIGAYVEPILDDHDIQGNVLAGFNKPNQRVIGLRIVDLRLARVWLAEVEVSTTKEVAAFNAAYRAGRKRARKDGVKWFGVALSSAGMQLLRPEMAAELPGMAFRQDLAARGVLPVDVPARPAHILAVLAWDDGVAVDSRETLARRMARWGLEVVFDEPGRSLGGKEHFGFNDDVSQPGVRGRLSETGHPHLTPRQPGADVDGDLHAPECSKRGQVLLWPGEIVLGYPRQSLRHPREPEPAAACPAWARNGSFLVYLRLEQDVHRFLTSTTERERAELVGRWPSGAPLVVHPEKDPLSGADFNDFGYGGDPAGKRCPFAAHVRKVNPRDDTTDEGGAAATLRRRMLRRGIPYGAPYDGQPGGERGLLFLGYQASIEDQFEVVMSSWIRDGLRPAGGIDSLITRFVRARAGGYFFVPAISTLRRLAG